jgi:hypothetical protein
MDDNNLADFLQFAKKHQRKFAQIAKATKQEYGREDVQNEAWVLIAEWKSSKAPIRLDDAQDIDRLFGYLYNKLVKGSEKKIRNSVRLDHYSYGDSSGEEAHPLMNKLAAPENTQPLEILLALEAAAELPSDPEPHESRAAAYLYLLQQHHNNMKYVAEYLLISLSYCYFRVNEAREMARTQHILPDTTRKSRMTFSPGPWRSFRLTRIEQALWLTQPWIQIELDLRFPSAPNRGLDTA